MKPHMINLNEKQERKKSFDFHFHFVEHCNEMQPSIPGLTKAYTTVIICSAPTSSPAVTTCKPKDGVCLTSSLP